MQRPNPAMAITLAALTLSAALAGCLGAEDPVTPTDASEDQGAADPEAERRADEGAAPAPQPNASQAAAQPPLGLTACTEHIGVFAMPAVMFVGELPEGFEPEPFENTPGTIGLFVLALGCESGTRGQELLADPGMLAGGLLVRPPPQLEGADVHGVLVGAFVEQPLLLELLVGWGFPAEEGSFSQNTVPAPTGGSLGTAEGGSGGFTVGMATVVPPGLDAGSGYTARIFSVDNGAVTGYMQVSTQGAETAWTGEATLTLPEVPPAHQGVAIHRMGDGYRYQLAYTNLTGEA